MRLSAARARSTRPARLFLLQSSTPRVLARRNRAMAGFWRPGADAPSTSAPSTLLTLDVDADADATGTLIQFEKNPKASLSARRRALPIAAHADELMYCVEKHQTTVVVGHTGCGKTTQIPQYLRDGGWCGGGATVAVTQPRRVAAQTVAANEGVLAATAELEVAVVVWAASRAEGRMVEPAGAAKAEVVSVTSGDM